MQTATPPPPPPPPPPPITETRNEDHNGIHNINNNNNNNTNNSATTTMFTHLSLGKVVSRTVGVFVDRFDVYMTISAIVLVPIIVLLIIFSIVLELEELEMNKMNHGGGGTGSTNAGDELAVEVIGFFTQHHKAVMLFVIMDTIFYLFMLVLGEGAVTRAVADFYASQTTYGWYVNLKVTTYHHFYSLFVIAIMIGSILSLGRRLVFSVPFAFMIILGFFYVIGMGFLIAFVSLSYPAVIVENIGPINALKRSMELSEGRRCYVFGSVFGFLVVKELIKMLLINIFNPSGKAMASITPIGIMISFVPELMYMPLTSILKFVLYTSIRVDKEGFTQSVLQRELVDPTPLLSTQQPVTQDYRQVSLMDDSKDTIATSLVSDFS